MTHQVNWKDFFDSAGKALGVSSNHENWVVLAGVPLAPIGWTGQWGFFCCILPPHSCNLKAVQNLLKKYEKESSEKELGQ